MPQVEALVPALAAATRAGSLQYNVHLGNLGGYVQHVLENHTAGALVDMSTKCDLSVTAATTATSGAAVTASAAVH